MPNMQEAAAALELLLSFVARMARTQQGQHMDVQLLLCGARACTFRAQLSNACASVCQWADDSPGPRVLSLGHASKWGATTRQQVKGWLRRREPEHDRKKRVRRGQKVGDAGRRSMRGWVPGLYGEGCMGRVAWGGLHGEPPGPALGHDWLPALPKPCLAPADCITCTATVERLACLC